MFNFHASVFIIHHVFIQQLVDIWVVFTLGLWILLLWIFVHKYLFEYMFSSIFSIYLRVELLGHMITLDFPGGSDTKESACSTGDLSSIPGSGRSLEKGMATHSSILAWRIPWIEEPDRLQSTGLPRVRYDWAANTSYDSSMFNLLSTCQAVFQRACTITFLPALCDSWVVSFENLTLQFCCWHQIRLCVTLQFPREL